MNNTLFKKLKNKIIGKFGIVNILLEDDKIVLLVNPDKEEDYPEVILGLETEIRYSDDIEEKDFSIEEVKKIPKVQLMKLINTAKAYVKKSPVMIAAFKKYKVNLEELDNIPMFFKDIDVSARTEHGVIWLNYSLLSDGDFFKDYSYLVHESVHWLQQSTGQMPTQGSDEGEYLYNKAEQEGFKNQIKYIKSIFGKEAAEEYTDNLLDHHDVNNAKERNKLTNTLNR